MFIYGRQKPCFVLLFYHLDSSHVLYSWNSFLTFSEVHLPPSADTFTTQMGQAVFFSSTCSVFFFFFQNETVDQTDVSICINIVCIVPHHCILSWSSSLIELEWIASEITKADHTCSTRAENNSGSYLYHLKCYKHLGINRQKPLIGRTFLKSRIKTWCMMC